MSSWFKKNLGAFGVLNRRKNEEGFRFRVYYNHFENLAKVAPNLFSQITSNKVNKFSPLSLITLYKSFVKNITRCQTEISSWTKYEKSFWTCIVNQWFKRWRELIQNSDEEKNLNWRSWKKVFCLPLKICIGECFNKNVVNDISWKRNPFFFFLMKKWKIFLCFYVFYIFVFCFW